MVAYRQRNRSAAGETLRGLHGKERLRFLFDYYKLPAVGILIAAYIVIYNIHGQVTKTEPLLYAALVNVAAGEELAAGLGDGFLEYEAADPKRREVRLATGLCLTEDTTSDSYEYVYASQMKLLGSISGELLDVVLMNQEAFDAFSQNGYLCDLSELFAQEDPALLEAVSPCLVENIAFLSDNADELYYDPELPFEAETAEYPMGLDLSCSPLIREAGLNGTVYLGILGNSPRKEAAVRYVEYLISPLAD